MKKVIFIFYVILLGWTFCSAQVIETVILPPAQKTGGMPIMDAFQLRKSQRSYSPKDITRQELSNLLWAAYGINRPEGLRTVPAAKEWYEYDIYVVKAEGWYIYEPVKHTLLKMGNDDLRTYSGTQEFVKTAPVNFIFIADFDRMTNTDDETKKFFSATDVGYISQNVYLYCASAGLATIVRGQIDKSIAHEVLKLKPNQHVILAQTVGYPGE